MPFGGTSLEELFEPGLELGGDTAVQKTMPSAPEPVVTEWQLRRLAESVRKLGLAGVMHGDINDRNILLQDPGDSASEGEDSPLLLIDFGCVPPEYEGDEKALGEFICWYMDKSPSKACNVDARKRVEKAGKDLKKGLGIDAVLGTWIVSN